MKSAERIIAYALFSYVYTHDTHTHCSKLQKCSHTFAPSSFHIRENVSLQLLPSTAGVYFPNPQI